MARVRLCVCGSWFVGREGQAAHPRAPGQCLHFECRGAPARVWVWRCEGRPPLPHHFVCVEKFTYLPHTHTHRSPMRNGPCNFNAVGLLSSRFEVKPKAVECPRVTWRREGRPLDLEKRENVRHFLFSAEILLESA